MVTLHGFGPAFGLADPSPFVMKVIALLKIAGLPFTFEASDPRKGPKGKMPWIVDSGRTIADSTFIQRYLEETYAIDFYPGVDMRGRAIGWAIEKMCEDHLYFCAVHERWAKNENFEKGPRRFFDRVPQPMRALITPLVRRQIVGKVKGQGIGLHSDTEIIALAASDFEALAVLLGDNAYVLGSEQATASDAVVHAFVASALTPHFPGPLRDAVLAHDNLVAYCARLDAQWYGDED